MSTLSQIQELMYAYEAQHGFLPQVVVLTQAQYQRMCADLPPGNYETFMGARIRIAPPTDQGETHAG